MIQDNITKIPLTSNPIFSGCYNSPTHKRNFVLEIYLNQKDVEIENA